MGGEGGPHGVEVGRRMQEWVFPGWLCFVVCIDDLLELRVSCVLQIAAI